MGFYGAMSAGYRRIFMYVPLNFFTSWTLLCDRWKEENLCDLKS